MRSCTRPHEDTEATIADLRARVDKTPAFIKSVKPEQFANAETREIVLQFPQATMKFRPQLSYELRIAELLFP